MSVASISWVFYVVGLVLILGSWVNLVSPEVGWLGWGLGMLGWGAQFLPGVRKRTASEEVARLQALRTQGALSDEEFEVEKQKVLSRV